MRRCDPLGVLICALAARGDAVPRRAGAKNGPAEPWVEGQRFEVERKVMRAAAREHAADGEGRCEVLFEEVRWAVREDGRRRGPGTGCSGCCGWMGGGRGGS